MDDTFVLSSATVATTPDIQRLFHDLRRRVATETRIEIYSHRESEGNWLSTDDISNLLELEGYQVIEKGNGKVVARLLPQRRSEQSVSIVIPVRNEAGNLKSLIARIPKFGTRQELIFVEGHSRDDSWKELQKLKGENIRILKQKGTGKADAVRQGFRYAHGDIFIILDADLSVAPEELPKFYEAIVGGKGELVNGSRLVYPVEKEAMRFLNILGNQFFSVVLSWIINQHIKDTLCGTKALSRKNYERIAKARVYFGDFDPFGDFDLIFGAARLRLKIVEIPIRYHARTYGKTNISRFTHGWLLLKMTWFALWKLKWVTSKRLS